MPASRRHQKRRTVKRRTRRSLRKPFLRSHRGGAFNSKRPWHSLKKGMYKRIWKSRYNESHKRKLKRLAESQEKIIRSIPEIDAVWNEAAGTLSNVRLRPGEMQKIVNHVKSTLNIPDSGRINKKASTL